MLFHVQEEEIMSKLKKYPDMKYDKLVLLSRSIWREHYSHFRATGETSKRLIKIMDYVKKVYCEGATEDERPD